MKLLKRLYSVTWRRDGGEQLACYGLTSERVAARLRALVRESGPVTIESVDVEHGEPLPEISHADVWDAFVAGAKEGQRYPAATEHDLNRAADGYVKLREIRRNA